MTLGESVTKRGVCWHQSLPLGLSLVPPRRKSDDGFRKFQLLPPNRQERGLSLLLRDPLFSDRNKITFIGTGLVGVIAAVGGFIKKENVLDLIPVYVFRGQTVVGD